MSVLSNLKPKASLSRNAFDKSRRDVYSLKPGMLVPVFVEDTVPDSVYDVNVTEILRTQPIQSSPFARMSKNVEYFFVPYSQIFHGFEKLYYERGDEQRNNNNSAIASTVTQVPNFNIKTILNDLYPQYCYYQLYSKIKVYYSNYQLTALAFDEAYKSFILNTVGASQYFDIHNRFCIFDSLRLLDNLGYGNYLPVFKNCFSMDSSLKLFDNNTKNLDDYLDAQSALIQPIGTYAALVNAILQDLQQIFDISSVVQSLIGSSVWNGWISSVASRYLSVFRLAAYLKIWSDFYRNSQYDVNTNYSYYFNFDYITQNSQTNVNSKIPELLKPRYRQWKKDLFTGSYPNAQFGSVAVAQLMNPSNIYVDGTAPSGAAANVLIGYQKQDSSKKLISVTSTSGSTEPAQFKVDTAVSALSIRQALAFQRYKERILRAGNRQTSLQTALFGDSSRFVQDNYVDFLGAFNYNIDFNSVPSTADTGDMTVGQLASNGVGTFNGNGFKYHSHDFGILIGVTYILPESEYNNYGFDPFVTKSESFDFYKPDFQNLGLDPVFNFNSNMLSTVVDGVIGYLAKYWEYKITYDKVHGEFYSPLPFDSAELGRMTSQISAQAAAQLPLMLKGGFAQFVTPKFNINWTPTLSYFYVMPSCVDNIFYAESSEEQLDDQFLVSSYHEVKCVLPMSVIGLPTF